MVSPALVVFRAGSGPEAGVMSVAGSAAILVGFGPEYVPDGLVTFIGWSELKLEFYKPIF